ncbi:uncharacterized protein DSM5745_05885 [Aspergillus mulundensis]|uniref:tRNA-splicing endonuclease subunit Sen54 N-terminal domain-containing protein n=1 Tax=Aspergillus mulundensis TaxID=1810919 RepID=A0A3D8RY93_9EURO|nr:Uncharacterized protein DSM5745_05885 [Aspergillus mulundensis]RDW79033.1 Uncharacterized protein DSM5745_05885 [Aspergillus mulundensis]
MADLDEDAINNSTTGGAHADIDLSDETQDFRMLNNLSFLDTANLSLPKRGEKDFEPNPTVFQADILSASRQAMHNALAYPRLHHPKNLLIGVYAPNGPAPPAISKSLDTVAEEAPAEKAAEKAAPVSIGAQVPADACVYVTKAKGPFFKSLGQADRWSRVWLLPEEALYLLERGTLDIRWPRCAVGDGDEDDIEDSGLPMSLQAAYACLMGRGGLTMERYSVFTGLRRLGYAVLRAPGWSESDEEKVSQAAAQSVARQGPGLAGIFSRFMGWLCDGAPTTAVGPVAGLGFHHSYDRIYRKLSLIPFYDPVTSASPSPQPRLPYAVVWHVYKPSTSFRKSAPPDPDFKIAVINARTTTIPTVSQIWTLLESTPLNPPRPNSQLYVRLKNGYRNVILAVVDQGVVSYLKIADAAFGKEKLYAQRPSGGNKNRGPPRHKFKKR